MHEGTKRLLFLSGLFAAWLLPCFAILAILVGRIRPAYHDWWRMQLTAATGFRAEFSTLEHPLPQTVRLPRATFRDSLRNELRADCESLVLTTDSDLVRSAWARTVQLDAGTLRAWADHLARRLAQPPFGPAPSWRISADRVLVTRGTEIIWRGAAFRGWTALQEGWPAFLATCRPDAGGSDTPPISIRIAVRPTNSGGLERVTTLDTGGRRLPLDLCRAVLGQNPLRDTETRTEFKGTITVRATEGMPARTPFAPDPNFEETLVSGELHWGRNLRSGEYRTQSHDEPSGVVRIAMDRLRLQNGRAVDGKAAVVEADGISPEAVNGLFFLLIGGETIIEPSGNPAPLARIPNGR